MGLERSLRGSIYSLPIRKQQLPPCPRLLQCDWECGQGVWLLSGLLQRGPVRGILNKGDGDFGGRGNVPGQLVPGAGSRRPLAATVSPASPLASARTEVPFWTLRERGALMFRQDRGTARRPLQAWSPGPHRPGSPAAVVSNPSLTRPPGHHSSLLRVLPGSWEWFLCQGGVPPLWLPLLCPFCRFPPSPPSALPLPLPSLLLAFVYFSSHCPQCHPRPHADCLSLTGPLRSSSGSSH